MPTLKLRHRYPRVAEALAEAQALAHAVGRQGCGAITISTLSPLLLLVAPTLRSGQALTNNISRVNDGKYNLPRRESLRDDGSEAE